MNERSGFAGLISSTAIGFAVVMICVSTAETQPEKTLVALAERGDLKGVKTLLAKGVDVNRPIGGKLPLTSAAREAHVDVVRALLSAGANPCATEAVQMGGTRALVTAGVVVESQLYLLQEIQKWPTSLGPHPVLGSAPPDIQGKDKRLNEIKAILTAAEKSYEASGKKCY